MSKEAKLLLEFDAPNYSDTEKLGVELEILSDIFRLKGGYDLINLNLIKEKIDEGFEYLYVKQRFIRLNKLIENKIHITDKFYIDGHGFETLDEVEVAIKNKAFL